MTVNDSKGKQSAVQGVFSWRDDGQHYVLDLRNPLGSTQARLEGGPGVASLTYANGRQMFAADPDALIEDALGSRMPVVGLRDWLRGRVYAPPTLLGMVQDDQQRPLAFEQGGWRAHLSRYDALGPRLLVLERNDAGRHMVLRLVLNPP
jgi:outer membrane lipoprotein LolB